MPMLVLRRVVLAGVLMLGATGQAQAAALPFTGSLAFQIGAFDPIVVQGNGVATVNGDGTGGPLTQLSLPSGVFAVSGLSVPLNLPPISGVAVTAEAGAGAFATDGGTLGGPMPILGVARVCLFLACGDNPPVSLSLPLSVVGVGGSESVSFLVDLTISGSPWTTGMAVVGSNAMSGFARGPLSGVSSTAMPGGLVRLVTPILITTGLDAFPLVPAFGILTVQFVPEPGTLVLLSSGIVALVAFGRSQRRA